MSAKSAAGLTISEAIKRDHRDLERFYENFGKSAGDLKAQQGWANQFIWENARHAGTTDLVLICNKLTLFSGGRNSGLPVHGEAFAEWSRNDGE